MITEGIGPHAPGVEQIRIESADRRILRDEAIQRVARRKYAGRNGTWAQGLARGGRSGLSSAEEGTYVSMIGEYATCCYINRHLGKNAAHVNLDDEPYGDGGKDIVVYRLRIEVKTQQSHCDVCLVRVADERGRRVVQDSHALVFCEYLRDRDGWVSLLGFMPTRKAIKYPRVPAQRFDHVNVQIPLVDLLPMSRLLAEIRQRKEGLPCL